MMKIDENQQSDEAGRSKIEAQRWALRCAMLEQDSRNQPWSDMDGNPNENLSVEKSGNY